MSEKSGLKYDQGKIKASLVIGGFAKALEAVAEVGTIGADKYSPNGWKEVQDGENRYSDAMMRHYLLEQKGQLHDDDLTERAGHEVLHASCVAWNALARLNFILERENENEGK